MKACGDALIGKGTSTAQVQFPESAAFEAKGPLLAFNGPASGGGATAARDTTSSSTTSTPMCPCRRP